MSRRRAWSAWAALAALALILGTGVLVAAALVLDAEAAALAETAAPASAPQASHITVHDDAGGELRVEPCQPAGYACILMRAPGRLEASWALEPAQARAIARALNRAAAPAKGETL